MIISKTTGKVSKQFYKKMSKTLLLITIGYTEFDLGITELHFEIASADQLLTSRI